MPLIKRDPKIVKEESRLSAIPVQRESPWYEYETYLYSKNPTKDKMKQIEDSINSMLNKLNIKHSHNDWIEKKEYLSDEQLQKIKNYNPKKGTTNKDIKKLIKEVKNAKMKKIDTEDIQHQINEVEKLLKSTPKALKKLVKADKEHLKYHPSKMDKEELKLDTKIMKQSKDYTHKVKNVSHAVKNYVDQFIDIYKNSKTPQSRGKKLNDLKLNVYTNLKPSDIDDANTLIGEFKKTLDPIVKAKAKPKQSSPEDKKYKSVIAYVKKNKPSITNEEDLNLIASYLIDKNQRMSKKLLDEILKDLEY
jgi:hypothetical protein